MDFGNVLLGDSPTQIMRVTNVSGDQSSLSGVFPAASGDFSPGFSQNFGPVAGGQLDGRTYRYSPTVRGEDSQNVTLTSNGGDQQVNLRGRGVAPQVELQRDLAGFTRVGTTGHGVNEITNIGDGNLSGLGARTNLKGTLGAPSGPLSGASAVIDLADGQSLTSNYTFTPTRRGGQSQIVPLALENGSSDGTNSAEDLSVRLSGVAVGPVFDSSSHAASIDNPAAPIDFGVVDLGSTTDVFITLDNTTTDRFPNDMTLTQLSLDASLTARSFYSLIGVTSDVLDPDESLVLQVRLNPTGFAPGSTLSDTLTINTDQNAAFGDLLDGQSFTFALTSQVGVPEPASAISLLGGCGLMFVRRRRASLGGHTV